MPQRCSVHRGALGGIHVPTARWTGGPPSTCVLSSNAADRSYQQNGHVRVLVTPTALRQTRGGSILSSANCECANSFCHGVLAEGVVGTVAALSAVIDRQGWTLAVVLVGIAGMGLTFGMWWVYYLVPSGEILQRHRNRASVWGYAQILIVTSIVATGAGLHVAASFIEQKADITPMAAMLAVAVPVVLFLALLHALHYFLVRHFRSTDAWLPISSIGVG